MKRITIILLTLFALCFLIGCEISDPIGVGAYKRPRDNWDLVQIDKEYGHNGFDIYSPEPDVIEQYCSLCHYVN